MWKTYFLSTNILQDRKRKEWGKKNEEEEEEEREKEASLKEM
jgi:hypothetical protein